MKVTRSKTILRLARVPLMTILLMTAFLLAAAPLSPAFAKLLTESQIRIAAETYARTVTRDARPDAVVTDMEPYRVDGEVVAWIAHLDGGGYCLCGADDLVLPVYFYVPEGEYDLLNPSNECILDEINERTKLYRSWVRDSAPELNDLRGARAQRAALWNDLLAGREPSRISENILQAPSGTTVEPSYMELPLTSLWSQGSPYNEYVPDLPPGSGEHCVTGCVATSMSQVMDYWEWPNTGLGTGYVYHKYRFRSTGVWGEEPLAEDPQITNPPGWNWSDRLEWVSDSGGKLRMSGYWDGSILKLAKNEEYTLNVTPAYETALDNLYNAATLDSSYYYAAFGAATYDWSMINDVHSNPFGSEDAEVAKLCYHAGVAAGLGYGLFATWGGIGGSHDALVDHFRYDPDAVVYSTSIAWLTDDITWLRPCLIMGCKHQWVILGYDKSTDPDRLFLRNMGWGGSSNGWYTIDAYCDIGSTAQMYAVAPLGVVRFVTNVGSGDGSPNSPYGSINAALGAPSGTTLIFHAGESFSYMGTEMVIDKDMILKGENVTIYTEY